LQFFLLMLKAWESERRKTERDRNFKKLERKIKRKRKKENLREREMKEGGRESSFLLSCGLRVLVVGTKVGRGAGEA
jgi:hypothetical protein